MTSDGAGVVLRDSGPNDSDALAAMHDRCSLSTVFDRGPAGRPTLPRRLLNRLIAPPRGRTVVAVTGHQVVAVGRLINTADPAVGEVSLLVEDDLGRVSGRIGRTVQSPLAGSSRPRS